MISSVCRTYIQAVHRRHIAKYKLKWHTMYIRNYLWLYMINNVGARKMLIVNVAATAIAP